MKEYVMTPVNEWYMYMYSTISADMVRDEQITRNRNYKVFTLQTVPF